MSILNILHFPDPRLRRIARPVETVDDTVRRLIDDIDLAADQFPELCKAGLHLKMVLGLRKPPTDEEIDRVIAGAVDMFLCKYGVDGDERGPV